MKRTVPIMNGYNSIMDNVGKTRNTGVEIVLNSVNVETKDFRWGSTFNFALNRDKIIELRGDGNDDLTNKWFIGEPVRVHYDSEVDTGIDRTGCFPFQVRVADTVVRQKCAVDCRSFVTPDISRQRQTVQCLVSLDGLVSVRTP